MNMKRLFFNVFFAMLLALPFFIFANGNLDEENFVSSIVKRHNDGFFVEFTSIGFSLGNMEVSTQPIFDILGAFNLNLRYYFSPSSVLSLQTFLYDPLFIGKAYGGQSFGQDVQFYVLLNRSYYHNNVYLPPIVFRSHAEFLSIILGNYNFSEYAGSTVGRGFLSVGYPIGKSLELFGMLESGVALNVWTSENVSNDEWNNFVNELREKTFYSTIRVGVSWYYDNYSGLEIGYRFILSGKDSPLRYIQGFTIADIIYNIFQFQEDQTLSIPFITTDYYLSFSTKF